MPWMPPQDYEGKPDDRLKEEFVQVRLAPRTTAFRMYQVIVHGKEPVLQGARNGPNLDAQEFTPPQARYAFRKHWVPMKWLARMTEIALSDGESTFPAEEAD